MALDVSRQPWVAVTEHLLNRVDGRSGLHQQARRRVPLVLKANLAQIGWGHSDTPCFGRRCFEAPVAGDTLSNLATSATVSSARNPRLARRPYETGLSTTTRDAARR